MNEKYIDSHCIGEWERGDETCNGSTDGDEGDSEPCSWRNRCRVFTMFLEVNKKRREQYIEVIVDDDGEVAEPLDGMKKFKEFCDELIASSIKGTKRKTSGKQGKFDKRKLGPTPIAKRAGALARSKRARERTGESLLLFNDFKQELAGRLKDREFAEEGEIVFPGQLYVINRLKVSKYLSLYCMNLKGRSAPIASLRVKTAEIAFDVALPLTVEELENFCSKAAVRKLKPVERNNGRFHSILKNLDGEKMILLAEVLAKLISSGKIELPIVQV